MDNGGFYDVIFDLENFHPVPGYSEAHVGVRNVFQGFCDQSVQGFGAVLWKLPAKGLVYRANGRRAVNNESAVFLGNDVRAG